MNTIVSALMRVSSVSTCPRPRSASPQPRGQSGDGHDRRRAGGRDDIQIDETIHTQRDASRDEIYDVVDVNGG